MLCRLYSDFEISPLPTQNITLNPIPQRLILKSKVFSSLTLSTLVLFMDYYYSIPPFPKSYIATLSPVQAVAELG